MEVGRRRTFAGALDWPGWCRGGRDENAAMEALFDYAGRYARVVGARRGFSAPKTTRSLKVVERLEGNATTEFGAPGIPPSADDRPLDDAEAKRQIALLAAAWRALDRSAKAAAGKRLSTGPRGGGRALDAIVRHVLDAEIAYLSGLGGRYRPGSAGADQTAEERAAVRTTLSARVRGEVPHPRRSAALWSPRYFVRRAAWHALDHAWEIEDRSSG